MSDDIAMRARRRTRAVVAVAAVALMVLACAGAGLVVLLGHRGGPVPPPAQAGSTSAGGHAVAPAQGVTASTPATSSLVGADLTWTSVAGARLPVSRGDGPRDSGSGRARGFTQTPQGAVLAAAHITLRLCPQVGPTVFEPTLHEQVIGAGAAALRQRLDDDYQQARARLGLPYGTPAGQLYSATRGYRVDLDSPTTAAVRLLIEGPGGSGGSVLVALVVHLQWVGQDWAVVAPAAGDWSPAQSLITDTTGYTRFPDGG